VSEFHEKRDIPSCSTRTRLTYDLYPRHTTGTWAWKRRRAQAHMQNYNNTILTEDSRSRWSGICGVPPGLR
jgi:hypothetical protein